MKYKDGSYSVLPIIFISFFATLFLAVLKLNDKIHISWWWVVAPWTLVSAAIIGAVLLLAAIFSMWK